MIKKMKEYKESNKLIIEWKNGTETTLTFCNKKDIDYVLKKFNSFFCRSILVGVENDKRYLIVKNNVNSLSCKGKKKEGGY